MTRQNFIAKALCSLGGDKYTKEGTVASLGKALQKAKRNRIRLDINNDRWILFSDLHKGAKNRADDFRRSEDHYIAALNHYYAEGYSLCVMGDAEELWEEFPRTVIRNNAASFAAEKRFHDQERYLRLWGNHDEIWGSPSMVARLLQPLYGQRHLEVSESILLEAMDQDKPLGNILLIHGHQGTQNDQSNNNFSKWILHNIWRPLQVLTGFSCNTPATDWKLRRERDKIIYQWTANEPGLILIAGHTHAPVFASFGHRARLMTMIASARAKLETLPENKHAEEQSRINELSSSLQNLESNLSVEERQEFEPLDSPLPCYFNTGCCCFADGDITGLELSAGEIRLVRWPDDNGLPQPKTLEEGSLIEIFNNLK